jgi:hypothetical protein
MRKAFPERLDEGFLACPAIEEAQRPVARIEAEVGLVLAAGKETRRDFVRVAKRAHGFDVDSDLASGREGVHSNIFAVRYVEAQVRVAATSCESRLAMHALGQFDRFRPHTQPFRKQLAKPRPRNGESAALAIEGKAAGSASLRVREQGGRCANGLRLNLQPGHGDLDLVNRYLGHRNSAQQYSMTRRTVFGRKRISSRLPCCL